MDRDVKIKVTVEVKCEEWKSQRSQALKKWNKLQIILIRLKK